MDTNMIGKLKLKDLETGCSINNGEYYTIRELNCVVYLDKCGSKLDTCKSDGYVSPIYALGWVSTIHSPKGELLYTRKPETTKMTIKELEDTYNII